MLFGTRKFMLQNEAGEGGSGGGGAGDDKNKGGSGNPPAEGTGDSGKKDDKGEGQGSGNFDVSTLPKEAQDLIKSLRKENADHRTKNNALSSRLEKLEKGLKGFITGEEDEQDEDPEVKLGKVQSELEALTVRNALYQIAIENGIGPEDYEFFEFKMSKKLSGLQDNEEMTEEDLSEILGSLPSKAKGKGPANTGVGTGKKPENNGGQEGEITLEQFVKMGVTQKSKLYTEKPDLYNKLLAESKSKKLI